MLAEFFEAVVLQNWKNVNKTRNEKKVPNEVHPQNWNRQKL
jgi:hypothetical protein